MKIDGKQIAQKILEELKLKIQKLDKIPRLAIILVGNDPASKAYVNQKKIKGGLIRAKIDIKHFPNSISQADLLSTIQQFNNNNSIHGIIVQQPLPSHINIEKTTQAIDPKKDVDGFHSDSNFETPISMAVFKILKNIYAHTFKVEPQFIEWLKNKKVVVFGKGETGGEPIINSLRKMGIDPIVIDSKTENPQTLTRNADIIISAVGKPQVIKPNMIKKGVVLISIGLHKGSDGKLHGDYNEEEIKDIASFYTPTPGGVGPVNVAMLMDNLVDATENY